MKRNRALGALLVFGSLAAMPAGAQDLFKQPTLFGQPKLFTAPQPLVRTPGAPTVPSLSANQCRVLTGTCPTGRLERVGTTCFCNTARGQRRQGTTEIRPQGTFKNGP
jgi:hypothetical protein